MNVVTFTPGGLFREAEGNCRDPYAKARSYRMRQPLDSTFAFPGPSAGTTDIPDYAEPPSQPSAVQRSGKGGKGKQTDEAIPGRKRTLRGKPCDLSHSTKAVSLLTNIQESGLKEPVPASGNSHCH